MLKVFRAELYLAVRSVSFWVCVLALMLLSTTVVSVGIRGHTPREQIIVASERNERIDSVVNLMSGANYTAYYDDAKTRYVFEAEGYDSLNTEGALTEALEPIDKEHITRIVWIEGSEYPLGTEHIIDRWAMKRMCEDLSGIFFAGILFALFFFCRSAMYRSYSGYLISGRSRWEIAGGKLLAYMLVAVMFTVAEFVRSVFVFTDNGLSLGIKYLCTALAARGLVYITIFGMCALIPAFVDKAVVAGLATLAVLVLLFSNRAPVQIPLFDSYLSLVDKLDAGASIADFLPVILIATATWAVLVICVFVCFERKKLR